jgi:endoglycosylceramidase
MLPRRDPGVVLRATAAMLMVVVLLGACSSVTGSERPANAGTATTSMPVGNSRRSEGVELRPLSASTDLKIVDDRNREVLLRGANVNSLGEYWQGVPDQPSTLPVTGADWDAMAARGLSAVRLIVSWSRLEPERGRIDTGYLDQVEAQVEAAAARGIYTIIDMHQDAYSAFISTPDPATCPPGTQPAKGWDGAPRWATITDGASTCLRGGDRNSSPAVIAAWNHFYDNTDGIRDRFAATWGEVARRFAGRSEVAGYNLLNEPEVSRPGAELTPRYDKVVVDAVNAIRAAEQGAPFPHLIIVEPALPAGNPSYGLVIPDPVRIGVSPVGIVAGPHNYAESINNGLNLTIEGTNDLFLNVATGLGVPVWVGEYGFWGIEPETLAKVQRFAADQDKRVLGGAWWQWRQSCGDPHAVQWSDGAVRTLEVPAHTSRHLNALECPGNKDLGPTAEFMDVLGRAYPRAAPGRIAMLTSDAATGAFALEAASAPAGETLIVWTPTPATTHRVTGTGLGDIVEHAVPGGRMITAVVTTGGAYALRVTRA